MNNYTISVTDQSNLIATGLEQSNLIENQIAEEYIWEIIFLGEAPLI